LRHWRWIVAEVRKTFLRCISLKCPSCMKVAQTRALMWVNCTKLRLTNKPGIRYGYRSRLSLNYSWRLRHLPSACHLGTVKSAHELYLLQWACAVSLLSYLVSWFPFDVLNQSPCPSLSHNFPVLSFMETFLSEIINMQHAYPEETLKHWKEEAISET
jgi:hypothetical protein